MLALHICGAFDKETAFQGGKKDEMQAMVKLWMVSVKKKKIR